MLNNILPLRRTSMTEWLQRFIRLYFAHVSSKRFTLNTFCYIVAVAFIVVVRCTNELKNNKKWKLFEGIKKSYIFTSVFIVASSIFVAKDLFVVFLLTIFKETFFFFIFSFDLIHSFKHRKFFTVEHGISCIFPSKLTGWQTQYHFISHQSEF